MHWIYDMKKNEYEMNCVQVLCISFIMKLWNCQEMSLNSCINMYNMSIEKKEFLTIKKYVERIIHEKCLCLK